MSNPTLEVATTSAILSGRCAPFEYSGRLVDILRQVTLLVLTDCDVRPIWEPSGPAAVAATCHVPVGQIVWARPIEGAGGPAGPREGAEEERIEKVPHPVLALASLFVIRGNVHLVQGADPTLAFERLAQGFLPLTDATVVWAGNEAAPWKAPFIALNGLLVESFSIDEGRQAAA